MKKLLLTLLAAAALVGTVTVNAYDSQSVKPTVPAQNPGPPPCFPSPLDCGAR